MKGGGKTPPFTSISNIFWSFIGAFLGITSIHYTPCDFLEANDINMVIGSFGASAILIYGAIDSPLT